METVHSCILMVTWTGPWVSILKCGTTMCRFNMDKSIAGRRSPVFTEPGTAGCRTREKSRCWPSLWPPWPAEHPRPSGDPGSCSCPGTWCTNGWAEVFEGKLCPPHPRQCWPGPCQCCLAEEAEAAVLAFLRCPGKGRLWAPLPAPAWKDWSWDTVL